MSIRHLVGSATQVIDAGGRLVVPGFNDAHVHLVIGAEELVGVDLRPSRDARRHGRASRALRGDAASGRVDHRRLLGSRGVARRARSRRAMLVDAVTPNHPVFVQRLDGHMALANSLAMTAGRHHRTMSRVRRRRHDRSRRARPAHRVFKDAAMDLVTRAIPADTLDTILVKDARGAEARGVARRHDHAGHDGERGRARGVPGRYGRAAS